MWIKSGSIVHFTRDAKFVGKTQGIVCSCNIVAGSAREVKEQLRQFEESGLQRVMLQWLDLDDLAGLEALAKAIL